MALTVAGLSILSFLDDKTGIFVLTASLIILGAGFALFSSPNTNAIMRSIVKKYYGVGGATLSTMRIIGQVMSLGISTLLFALFLGKSIISEENIFEFIKSIKLTFRIFTFLCFAGIFFSLVRGRVHKNGQTK